MSFENEQNRARIAQTVLDYLDNPMGRILAVKAPPGVGKTATVYDTLWNNRIVPIYLAPMHRVITENITLSTVGMYSTLHLKGKTLSCLRPEVRQIIDRTTYFDVSPFCESCPMEYKRDCDHCRVMKDIYRNPKPWASVHSYIPLFLPEYLDERGEFFDVLVIDENPLQYVLVQKSANDRQLYELQRVLDNYEDVPEKHFFNRLIDQLVDGHISGQIPYDRIIELAEGENLNLRLFAKNWKTYIAIELWNHELEFPPVDVIEILSKIIPTGIAEEASMEDMIFVVKDLANDRRYVQLNHFDRSALREIRIPIIYLDASLNWEITQYMFMREIYPLEITCSFENIFQLSTGKYPLSSWKRMGFLQRTAKKRLMPLIRLICNSKQNNVLLVCTKQIQDELDQYLINNQVYNYRFANFYGLRGQNRFMRSCDTVIICMRPSPPGEQMRSFHNLSGIPINIWEEMLVKDEIIQAIGRLRQNIPEVEGRTREKMEIYIITNTDLGFDNWIKYDQLWKYVSTGVMVKEEEEHKVLALALLKKIKEPTTKTEALKLITASQYAKRMAFDYLISKGYLQRNRSIRKFEKTNKGKLT